MLVQVCGFFVHLMLIIFGIVAGVKCPEALAQNAMYVFGFLDVAVSPIMTTSGLIRCFETCGLTENPLMTRVWFA